MATFVAPLLISPRSTEDNIFRLRKSSRWSRTQVPSVNIAGIRANKLCMRSSDEIAQAPHVIRNARAVVVGGGPVGTVAAAMLWFRGVKDVTLIEKVADFKSLNPSTSYSLGVYPRGTKALSVVPGLVDLVGNNGAPFINLVRITVEGTTKTFPFPPPLTSVRYYIRDILLRKLKTFLLNSTTVSTRYGSNLKSISYKNEEIELEIETEGKVEKISSDLVIAADGQNSVVTSSLQTANTPIIRSSHGKGKDVHNSASVGLKVKSIVLNPDELANFGLADEDIGTSLIILDSAASGKSTKERVKLRIFPTPRDQIDEFGGLLGVMINSPDSVLWSVESVNEFYALLQRNFPAVNMHKLIAPHHVETFLSTNPVVFPSIMRMDSLTAFVGDKSGVIIIGDAAHSFPPDTGLGLNSGFEDVAKLAYTIDGLTESSTIHDLLADYESRNHDETSALVYIARVAAPFQYGNAPIRRKIHSAYGIVRSLLAQQFPFLFALPLNMQALGLRSYTDMVQRDRLSARIVFFVAFVAFVGYGFYAYDQFQTYFL